MAIVNSSGYSFGTNTYGSDSFGVDVLPAVSTSAATTSATASRVRLAAAVISASGSVAAIGGFTANGDGQSTSTATTSASATNVRTSGATAASIATTAANAVATFVSGAASSSTTVTTSVGEKFVLEDSSKFAYGTSTYGSNVYDYADFQTIVSATSVGTTATAYVIRQAVALVEAVSVVAVGTGVLRIRQTSSAIPAAASTSTNAVYSIAGHASLSAQSTLAINYLRIRKVDGSTAVASAVEVIAREKWETNTVASQTWSANSATNVSWEKIAA